MLWWVVPLIIYNILAAYFSWKLSISSNTRWQYLLFSLNLIPLWVFVAKTSKNIVLDGIVYDVVLTLSYTTAILFFTRGQIVFSMLQYLGVGIILIGFIILKIGG